MKKMISAAILCLSMLTNIQAEDYIDYVSVGLALQTLQDSDSEDFNQILDDDTGMAVVLNVGKYLYDDIALEFEGTATVTNPEWKLPTGESDEVDFWSLGFYGVYIWKINNLSIRPRIGLVYENMESKLSGISLKDKSDLALSGGIGLTYQFGQHYEIYSNYTKFEDDINHLTFGATYKF
jgi:outer membrane receptor protein involved in Fe transport